MRALQRTSISITNYFTGWNETGELNNVFNSFSCRFYTKVSRNFIIEFQESCFI